MTAAQYDVLAAKSGASAAEIVAKIYGVDNWGFECGVRSAATRVRTGIGSDWVLLR
jgi:hypothetical protein